MSGQSSSSSAGIGFTGLLCLLFIGLRLCGVILWPWKWVLAPLWIPGVVLLFLALLFLVIWCVVTLLPSRGRR